MKNRFMRVNTSRFFCYLAVMNLLLSACGKIKTKSDSVEAITDTAKQSLIFANIMNVTDNAVNQMIRSDSLSFLVLPIEASCPSCRKKTIDSIVKNKDHLANNSFVIISANSGRKTINSFFEEQNYKLP